MKAGDTMAEKDSLVQPYVPAGRVIAGWVLGLVCFVYLLSFPPTLNPSDESFLLYEAKRVFQGDALYRDFFDFLTPGSYYLYALAYALGGVSITSAKVTTALLHAVSVMCTYFLALYVASVGEALMAGLLVAVICVPAWNMASHHWMATTFGLATLVVLLAPRWRSSLRARPAAVGALAGMVMCTTQGRGVWMIAGLTAAISLLVLGQGGERRWRRWLGELAWTAVGGASVCFTVLGYAVWHSSLAEMWYATYTWVLESYRHYNVGSSFLIGKLPWAGQLFRGSGELTYPWLLANIPRLLGIEIVALLLAILRRGLGAQLTRAALLVVAFSSIAGVAYFPDIAHVAFVTPFALPVLAGMVYRVRTGFALSQSRPVRAATLAVWAGALAMVLAKGWNTRQLLWGDPVFYDTAFGTIAGTAWQQSTLAALREKVRVDGTAPPRIFAYPTDAWIYLTLPADNPTPFCLLRQRYNTHAQFEIVKERLERDPSAIVFVSTIYSKPSDPFVQHVWARFYVMGRVGYGVLYGQYRRGRTAPSPPS
jgi:hypothetical protein